MFNLKDIIFAFPSSCTDIETPLLISSIRKSAGRFSNSPIWVVTTKNNIEIPSKIIDFFNSMNVTIIYLDDKSDIMKLPFKPCSFDYVYSKGVLQYISNVKECINSLSLIIKSEGSLSITLYPRMSLLFEAFNRIIRIVTIRTPIIILYWLSYMLIPFLTLSWKWSGVERRNIDWDERAHMIFNWLSSEFQNRATNEEAAGWFENLGFEKIRLSITPVGITGIKSSPGPAGKQ